MKIFSQKCRYVDDQVICQNICVCRNVSVLRDVRDEAVANALSLTTAAQSGSGRPFAPSMQRWHRTRDGCSSRLSSSSEDDPLNRSHFRCVDSQSEPTEIGLGLG